MTAKTGFLMLRSERLMNPLRALRGMITVRRMIYCRCALRLAPAGVVAGAGVAHRDVGAGEQRQEGGKTPPPSPLPEAERGGKNGRTPVRLPFCRGRALRAPLPEAG